MTIYSGQVSQMLQGVSQQSPKDRAEGQIGEQVNCLSDIVSGLRRRPGWRVLSELSGIATGFTLDEHTAIYSYSRGDGNEEYIMLFDTSGRIKIYDALTGAAKTVTNTASTYLTCADPVSTLRFHTIGDSTFVLNTDDVAEMESTTSDSLGHECLIHVKRANFGKTYEVTVDGTVVASYTTDSTVTISSTTQNKQLSLSTADVAEEIYDDIVAYHGGTPLYTSITRKDDVIHMVMPAAFDIAVSDGNHGNDLYATKNSVTEFAFLPRFAPQYYKIEIKGSGEAQWDNYWVQWEPDNGSATNWNDVGVWQECIGPSEETTIDQDTMPHLIVRQSDGTFDADPIDWGEREAGTSDTNPEPSFIDNTIRDIGSYQNRLYMLTGENVVMSRSHDHFFFFSSSVAQAADDDPIDSASSDNQITDVLHAVIFSGNLVVFSSNAQFIHPGDVAITPASFAVSAKSKFHISPRIKPVTTGNTILFPSEFGDYTNVWEYTLEDLTGNPSCESIGKHIPKYIAGNPIEMVANTATDLMFLRTDDNPSDIYVMQFYHKNGKRAQLAWHKWEMDSSNTIYSTTLLNTRLYAVVERGSAVYLEYLDMSLPTTAGSDYELFLDHWHSDTVTIGSYTVGNNDYTARVAVHETTNDYFVQGTGCNNPGMVVGSNSEVDSGYLYLNQPADAVVIQGQQFDSYGTLTNPFVRDTAGRPYTSRAQIDFVTYSLQETGYVEFTVEHATGDTYTQIFNGMVLNHWQFNIGQASLLDTDVMVPVRDIRELVTLGFTSDHHLGFALMSYEWQMQMKLRGRRSA